MTAAAGGYEKRDKGGSVTDRVRSNTEHMVRRIIGLSDQLTSSKQRLISNAPPMPVIHQPA